MFHYIEIMFDYFIETTFVHPKWGKKEEEKTGNW